MKMLIVWAVLGWSLAGNVCAQNQDPAADHRPGDGFAGRHQISRTLRNRNQLVIDFDDWNDLRGHRNVDSLLRLFVQDFHAFRDTVGVRVDSRRAEYRISVNGQRTLTFRTHTAPIEQYVFRPEEETVQVKTGQDTLVLTRELVGEKPRLLAVYLIVNRLEDIGSVMGLGLNAEVEQALQLAEAYKKRDLFRAGSRSRVSLDSLDRPRAVWSGRGSSAYFFGSVSLGGGLTRSQFYNTLNFDFGYAPGNGKTGFLFGFQMYHTFDRLPDGSPRLTLEPFVHVGLAQFPRGKVKAGNVFEQRGSMTLGYRGGNRMGFFEPHTFRIAGSISPLKWVRVEPEYYFNFSSNFGYPGLRVNVGL